MGVDIIVGTGALICLCVFLSLRVKLPSACAPLAAISLLALVLLLGGLCGALQPTLYVSYLVCGALGGYALYAAVRPTGAPSDCATPYRTRGAAALAPLGTAGFLLFVGGTLFFLGYLAWLQPTFVSFDEYSFWGTAAKQTALFGQLYVDCPIGTPWQATEFTALALVSYFVQGFGAFAPWKAIFASNLVLLAGLCAVVGTVETGANQPVKNKTWQIKLPLCVVAVLCPLFFTIYSHTAYFAGVWMNFLGDLPAGVLFGASVAFWLCVKRQPVAQWWFVLPVLCFAANIKNNTFVLALAAAGVIGIDGLFFAKHRQNAGQGRAIKAFFARLCGAVLCLAAPVVQYALWNRYALVRVLEKAQEGGYGQTSEPLQAVVFNGIKLLFGQPVAPYYQARIAMFDAYMQSMQSLFFTREISLFGTGATVCAVIVGLFLAAICLAKTTRERCRTALALVATSVCFALYWWMLLLSYAFVLKDSAPANPVSYARYFGSYYLGWFLIALAYCGVAMAHTARPFFAKLLALVLAAVVCLITLQQVEPQFSALGVSKGTYARVHAQEAQSEQLRALIPPDKTVYLIDQNESTGYHWFLYSQQLLPRILTYGTGGASYGVAQDTQARAHYCQLTQAAFLQEVQESGAAYLFVASVDAAFTTGYATLFDDGLASAQTGAVLYRVGQTGFALETPLTQEDGR